MLLEISESLEWFFSLKVVSDYLFPVSSGIYLTFFTASIIRFLDMKRSAERALDRIYEQIISAPIDLTRARWLWVVTHAFSNTRAITEELRDAGHVSAAETYGFATTRLMEKVASAVVNSRPPDLRNLPRSTEVLMQLLAENEGLSYRSDAADAFNQDRAIVRKAANGMRGSLLTFFQLRPVAGWIERAQDADLHHKRTQDRCRHCGERPYPIV